MEAAGFAGPSGSAADPGGERTAQAEEQASPGSTRRRGGAERMLRAERLLRAELEAARELVGAGERALVLGARPTAEAALLAEAGYRVRAIPVVSAGEAGEVGPRPPRLRSDFEIPCEDGPYDVVLSARALEDLPHRDALLAEVRRVLAPLGRAVFMLPTPPGRARGWRARWRGELEGAGFTVERVVPAGVFHTGHSLCPWLSLSARRALAHMLGSSHCLYVLRRAASSREWTAAASLPPSDSTADRASA